MPAPRPLNEPLGTPVPTIAHVAMPFARTGSAVTNVIRHLCREHATTGGISYAVVSHNRETTVEGATMVLVDHTTVSPKQYFSREQSLVDAALGAMGGERRYHGRLHAPAIAALREVHPDVIVVHEGHHAASTLPAWRRHFPDTRLVLYLHNTISRSYGHRELNRLLAPADAMVFVSNALRNLSAPRLSKDTMAKTHVVLNGTEAPVPSAPGTDPPVVQYVGQVSEHKGVHLLVDAALELFTQGYDFRVRIVGSVVHGSDQPLSAYEQSLRNRVEGHRARFEFIPFLPRPELDSLFRSAAVSCIPSVFADPCPLAALEAITYGNAVVASREGGLPEIGGDAFRYFEVGEPCTLVAALRDTLDNRAVWASAARLRAAELRWSDQYARLARILNP